ncbi:MAG: FG-GAP repeat domain-containing protein, partial [bacterium]
TKVDPVNPNTDLIVTFFGAQASGGGSSLSKIGPVEDKNIGPILDPESTPVLTVILSGDWNSDGCTDLLLLVNIIAENFQAPLNDYIAAYQGDCGGGLTRVNEIDLGQLLLIADMTTGDVDGNGVNEVYVSTAASTGSLNDPSTYAGPMVQVITNPLDPASTTISAGPTMPGAMLPTFVHVTDCDQGGTLNDLLFTGVETFSSPVPVRLLLISSDVLCFLNGGTQTVTVYPKSKLNTALNFQGIPFWGNIINTSQVGPLGAGMGWSGVQLLVVTEGNGGGGDDGGVSLGNVLFAEIPVDDDNGGGGGLCLQGGCANDLNARPPSSGMELWALLILLPYAAFILQALGRQWARARRKGSFLP